eukprot:4537209-Alexandrium_andersonii.AAC.1
MCVPTAFLEPALSVGAAQPTSRRARSIGSHLPNGAIPRGEPGRTSRALMHHCRRNGLKVGP